MSVNQLFAHYLQETLAVIRKRFGSASIARKMGEGELEEACKDLSFLVISGIAAGLVAAFAGIFYAPQIARLLGANEVLLQDTVTYLRVLMIFAPVTLLQLMFQSFYNTAGKGKLGMKLMILSGIVDAVLNVVFMGMMNMGIFGAALSTVIGHSVSAVTGVVMFLRRKEGLRFLFPGLRFTILKQSCFNGTSELITNLSGGITTFLFNSVLMATYGEAGVSSITIITYTQFFLSSIYIGFSSGVAPLFSFNLGAKKEERLHLLFKESIQLISLMSITITICSLMFSGFIVKIFSDPAEEVYVIAKEGMRILACSFLFTGMNTFATSFFQAMSRGKISSSISLFRKLILLSAGILLLPLIFEGTGVWLSILFAEGICGIISVTLLWKNRL